MITILLVCILGAVLLASEEGRAVLGVLIFIGLSVLILGLVGVGVLLLSAR